MFSLLPLKCIDFVPSPLLFNSLLSQAMGARNIGWPDSEKFIIICSAVVPDPSDLPIQVPYHISSDPDPKKTNDREEICEHFPQLPVNCVHIVLCFLLHPKQCRCTLTWRWSCLWSARVHTVDLSSEFESSRRGPKLWFLGIFPLELRRHTVNAIQFPWSEFNFSSKLQ